LHDDRFWCAWCQDWATITVRQVENVALVEQQGRTVLKSAPTRWYPLQPLRIPAGWTVVYNNGFYEVDPPGEEVPNDDLWVIFKQDMLFLSHQRLNRIIDLGWYPEGDMQSGEYGLSVYEGDFTGRLLHEFFGTDRLKLVEEIESLLRRINKGEL
jgi:hypothetical protein